MAKNKIVQANEKIAETVVEGYKKIETKFNEAFLNEDGTLKTGKVGQAVEDGYHKIEEGVVGGYKKIENTVVGGFAKMTDRFVDQFLTREGESVEDAKKRISGEISDEQ